MRALITLVLFTAACAPSPAAADNCSCTYVGGEVKLGETACIKTAKGPTLARCDMVVNNTSWTVLDQPCDVTVGEALPPHSTASAATLSRGSWPLSCKWCIRRILQPNHPQL